MLKLDTCNNLVYVGLETTSTSCDNSCVFWQSLLPNSSAFSMRSIALIYRTPRTKLCIQNSDAVRRVCAQWSKCVSAPSFHWLHMWWWVQWLLETSSYRSTLLCWETCMRFCTTLKCGPMRSTLIRRQTFRLQSQVTRSGSCWHVECRALYHSASGSARVSARRSHDRSCSYSLWDSCSAFAWRRVPNTRCRPTISEHMAIETLTR